MRPGGALRSETADSGRRGWGVDDGRVVETGVMWAAQPLRDASRPWVLGVALGAPGVLGPVSVLCWG